VTRSKLAWPLFLGLLVGGWAAAHGLAYRIGVPEADERRHLLEATGHGYLNAALLVSMSATLVAIGLGGCVLRGRVAAPAPSLFALLPPFAFVVQEHLERFLHTGEFPSDAALEPTFALGFLLQAPFAILAWVVARLLVTVARTVGEILRPERPRILPVAGSAACAIDVRAPRTGLLALGHGQRAPPEFLLR